MEVVVTVETVVVVTVVVGVVLGPDEVETKTEPWESYTMIAQNPPHA